MNRILFFVLMLSVIGGCSDRKSQDNDKDQEAYHRILDSIAATEEVGTVEAKESQVDSIHLDTMREDSIMKKQIDEEYRKGLVLEASKSNYKYVGDGTVAGEFRRDCKIINNTSIVLTDKDYQISYQYEDVDTIDGELWPVKKNKTMKGKELVPGGTYEFVIKIIGESLSKPSVKLKISKKEFEKRFREQTSFDSQSGKFVNVKY